MAIIHFIHPQYFIYNAGERYYSRDGSDEFFSDDINIDTIWDPAKLLRARYANFEIYNQMNHFKIMDGGETDLPNPYWFYYSNVKKEDAEGFYFSSSREIKGKEGVLTTTQVMKRNPFGDRKPSFEIKYPVNVYPLFDVFNTFFYKENGKSFLVFPCKSEALLNVSNFSLKYHDTGVDVENLQLSLVLIGDAIGQVWTTGWGGNSQLLYDEFGHYEIQTLLALRQFNYFFGIDDPTASYKLSEETIQKINSLMIEVVNKKIWVQKPRFIAFGHQFIGQFIQAIRKKGIEGLFSLNSQKLSNGPGDIYWKSGNDTMTLFAKVFTPDLSFVASPLPRENVDFSPTGAYSLYNWEIFYHTAILTATHLSKNQQYEQAMKWFHYIFDPTSNDLDKDFEETIATPTRFWKFLPFKLQPKQSLLEYMKEINEGKHAGPVAMWRDHPFRPHLVARSRVISYMRYTIMAYLDNLIAWGDMLFRQDTIESINEATNLYVMASHILGPRPQKIPARSKPRPETFASIHEHLDAFSNAGVPGEASLPYSTDIGFQPSDKTYRSLVGIGSTLYFCIPSNEKMLGYWDTVADRLFKIRHCMNIQGVERELALFEPPIDPGLLASAVAGGMSIGGALADLNAPLPFYRFQYMLQKAVELCAEVKALGNAILSASEKRDSEQLALIRATQEKNILNIQLEIKNIQYQEAVASKTAIEKSWSQVLLRVRYYAKLIGYDKDIIPSIEIPTLTKDNWGIPDIQGFSLDITPLGENDVYITQYEKFDLNKFNYSLTLLQYSLARHTDVIMESKAPSISINTQPLGVGVSTVVNPSLFGSNALEPQRHQLGSSIEATRGAHTLKKSTFLLRNAEWKLQFNLATRELIQIRHQYKVAKIREKYIKKEYYLINKQLDNSKQTEFFLFNKYSNQDLYEWMRGEMLATYKEAYKLAYDLAKRAERAYRFELGDESAKFIQYGYWNNAKDGLLSGEKLHLALKQMEKAYQENNRREFEITKNISLQMLDPLALIELKQTGKCSIQVPEVLFDMDYPGHYLRRIRSVAISIPCIAGPYTSVNCSLTLVSSKVRRKPVSAASPDEDEQFFEASYAAFTSIATSHGQNDSGMFELNFRDERYLPFEGAGVHSQWGIELPNEFRTFDYDTISDVILHIRYTSRPGTEIKMKENAIERLKAWQQMVEGASQSGGLAHLIAFQQEFSFHWHQLTTTGDSGEFAISKNRFPYFVQGRKLETKKLHVFAKLKAGANVSSFFLNINGQPCEMGTTNKDYRGLHHCIVEWSSTIQEQPKALLRLELKDSKTVKNEMEDMWIVCEYIAK